MDTIIRFSGVWWIINSKIWIIKDKLKIKWGKPSSKYFTKCYKIWEVTWEMIRKFKVFLSNFWDLQYRKSRFYYITFGYLQHKEGCFTQLLLDCFNQLLDIYNQNKANYPSFYWIFLSNLWISTDKFKITWYTKGSAGIF